VSVDKLGKMDVYIVSHHGLTNSGSPALVDAIAPRWRSWTTARARRLARNLRDD